MGRIRTKIQGKIFACQNILCTGTCRILRAYLPGGDVAVTDQLRQLGRLGKPKHGLRSHQGDVAATAETDQSRRLGRPKHGCALTSRRRLRDLLETEKVSKQSNMFEFPGNSLETRLVSRRRREDVSATSGDSSRHLVSRPVR